MNWRRVFILIISAPDISMTTSILCNETSNITVTALEYTKQDLQDKKPDLSIATRLLYIFDTAERSY